MATGARHHARVARRLRVTPAFACRARWPVAPGRALTTRRAAGVAGRGAAIASALATARAFVPRKTAAAVAAWLPFAPIAAYARPVVAIESTLAWSIGAVETTAARPIVAARKAFTSRRFITIEATRPARSLIAVVTAFAARTFVTRKRSIAAQRTITPLALITRPTIVATARPLRIRVATRPIALVARTLTGVARALAFVSRPVGWRTRAITLITRAVGRCARPVTFVARPIRRRTRAIAVVAGPISLITRAIIRPTAVGTGRAIITLETGADIVAARATFATPEIVAAAAADVVGRVVAARGAGPLVCVAARPARGIAPVTAASRRVAGTCRPLARVTAFATRLTARSIAPAALAAVVPIARLGAARLVTPLPGRIARRIRGGALSGNSALQRGACTRAGTGTGQ
ncbi:hypothetical protein GCM10025771_14310 [Niveibacterium umoris]|uniref:Uncharacterized protein n=1 Tax=Niveibacterium umoris TaxID=1193620 RepID=A0A840BV58_9RHOO|nr:hypothetical protein [Niveibacterium umoris]MBB4014696.1 hypothetical protein [Niveibacterium umoris]